MARGVAVEVRRLLGAPRLTAIGEPAVAADHIDDRQVPGPRPAGGDGVLSGSAQRTGKLRHIVSFLMGCECNVHFPMNVKAEKGKLIVKSFLGETTDRIAKILEGVKVEVKGNQVVVSGFNKETAGQTAANIEKATRLTGRDRRIFQDGIFITEKCGRVI